MVKGWRVKGRGGSREWGNGRVEWSGVGEGKVDEVR